jgi:hypothetical protein
MPRYRLGEPTSSGEYRVLDDDGRQVAAAIIYLRDADIVGVDRGDVFEADIRIEWTLHEQDAA